MLRVIFLSMIMVMTSCATTVPSKGCGYARSQQKKLAKYHRHHKHHSR